MVRYTLSCVLIFLAMIMIMIPHILGATLADKDCNHLKTPWKTFMNMKKMFQKQIRKEVSTVRDVRELMGGSDSQHDNLVLVFPEGKI